MIAPRKAAAALVFAAALAGATVAATTPVHAQLTFGFGFDFDGENDNFVVPRLCILTDRGLRDAIADQGYEDIFLNVPDGRRVQARARDGDWIYILEVNACTGDVLDRERLRRAEGA